MEQRGFKSGVKGRGIILHGASEDIDCDEVMYARGGELGE